MQVSESNSGKDGMCPGCGKRIARGARAGSLTSYLFQSFYCTCSRGASGSPGSAAARRAAAAASAPKEGKAEQFCPRCGLKIESKKSAGSITGFLFQDTRCKCADNPGTATGEMSQRFWKLKESSSDSIDTSGNSITSKPIDIKPGTIVGGIYRIVEMVGQGGMGEVYLAYHEALGKPCALKVIQPERLTDDTWQRFQMEAKAHANLDHVNLVKVTDLGIHEGCFPYYAMEYIEGQTLAELLETRRRLPLELALDIFIQVCDGVLYAHRKGLLHRDLKPSNIMLVKLPNGKFLVKVVDFGLVKQTQFDRSTQSLTKVGDIMGSPYYMSPEQSQGGKVDNRSDIYSVGCSLFEALTGQPPFIGDSSFTIVVCHQVSDPPSIEEVVGEGFVPPAMEVVMAKLLRKNPVERYQTLLELRSDLEKISRGENVEPVYMSRGRQSADTVEKNADYSDRLSDADGGQSKRLSKLLALGSVVLVVSAVGLIFYRNPYFLKKEDPKPVTKSNSDDFIVLPIFHETADRPASINDTKPYCVGVTKDSRMFEFPPDFSLGQLEDRSLKPTQCQGRVVWPLTVPIVFHPSVLLRSFPEYLKRFRAGDIYSIRLVDLDVLNPGHEENQTRCLDLLAGLPGVKELDLQWVMVTTNSDLLWIAKYKELESFLLNNGDIDGDELVKSQVLKPLKRFRWIACKDADVVFKSLSGCRRLEVLILPDNSVTVKQAVMVASIPKLETFECKGVVPDNPETTARIIEEFSKANKLKTLQIATLRLDSHVIAAFKSFTNLKVLKYNKASKLSPALIRQLSKAAPGLKLEAQ
jgi:serine/threonine protein kinase